MWFKNARIFQLNEDFTLTAEAFSHALEAHHLKPCRSMDVESIGWLPPFNTDSELFVLQSGDALLFVLGGEEKILPTTAVNYQLKQKIDDLTKQNGQQPGRKVQNDLKQQLTLEMLPQAFVKPKKIAAYIDTKLNLLIVDSASQNAAETVVTQLRQTLGSFKASAFGSSSSRAQLLTQWLMKGNASDGFEINHEVVLETLDEHKSIVRGRNIEHIEDQMQRHIDNGYLVTELGLNFNDRIDFSLGYDMGIKRIKFTDIVLDQLDENSIESEVQMLDTRFTLISLELRDLFTALFRVFGRE